MTGISQGDEVPSYNMVILPSYVQLPEEHNGNKQRRIRLYMYSLLGAWASLCWVSVKQVLAIRTTYKILRTMYS
jgi:hypothetical protein